jgi:hypothetical protein
MLACSPTSCSSTPTARFGSSPSANRCATPRRYMPCCAPATEAGSRARSSGALRLYWSTLSQIFRIPARSSVSMMPPQRPRSSWRTVSAVRGAAAAASAWRSSPGRTAPIGSRSASRCWCRSSSGELSISACARRKASSLAPCASACAVHRAQMRERSAASASGMPRSLRPRCMRSMAPGVLWSRGAGPAASGAASARAGAASTVGGSWSLASRSWTGCSGRMARISSATLGSLPPAATRAAAAAAASTVGAFMTSATGSCAGIPGANCGPRLGASPMPCTASASGFLVGS